MIRQRQKVMSLPCALPFSIVFLCVSLLDFHLSSCQDHLPPLNYSILSEGQSLDISLSDSFPFSNSYTINYDESTPDIERILNITFSVEKIRAELNQNMTASQNQQEIVLSENSIICIKTIYNQPLKILLLQNNIVMMYSYRQATQGQFGNTDSAFSGDARSESEFVRQIRNDDEYRSVTFVNVSQEFNQSRSMPGIVCSQIETLPLDNVYKLIVLCREKSGLRNSRNFLIAFNLQEDNRGFVSHMAFNSSSFVESKNIDGSENHSRPSQTFTGHSKNTSGQLCSQYNMKFFERIIIQQREYIDSVIVYCQTTPDPSQIKEVYEIYFDESNKISTLISSNPNRLNITNCLLDTSYVTEYENGFVSVSPDSYIFKYMHRLNKKGLYETSCSVYVPASIHNYSFITSRNESGVESIYIIFADKIMILESYSPNYQTLKLDKVPNGKLISYAISKGILFLHYHVAAVESEVGHSSFGDQPKTLIYAYNIRTIYPHLIDIIQVDSKVDLYLFSVLNYLESGNFFFMYDKASNCLNLTYYEGERVLLSIVDQNRAIGELRLFIRNSTGNHLKFHSSAHQQQFPEVTLPVFVRVKGFLDASIEQDSVQDLKVNNKIFSIDLVEAVTGPSGRFYKMPNSITELQFVNSFNEIQIPHILSYFPGRSLMAFSVNTVLTDPILTFYYERHLVLNCDLEFNQALMRVEVQRCVKASEVENNDTSPSQMVIYEQGKFIEHEGHKISFCAVTSGSSDVKCLYRDFEVDEIKSIQLISFHETQDGYEVISVFVVMANTFKQKDYKKPKDATDPSQIEIFTNSQVGPQEIKLLEVMGIKAVEFDDGFQNFLLLYLINETVGASEQSGLDSDWHVIQIYSKPKLQSNHSSHFIGHLVKEFVSTEIENVFILENRIIIVERSEDPGVILEYEISDFKCVYNRRYPLYDHEIVSGGQHSIASGFLFLEVRFVGSGENPTGLSKFLVYNPSLRSTNILTHYFRKNSDSNLMYASKLKRSHENVMAINGQYLITLSLPNIVIKLKGSKEKRELQVPRRTDAEAPFEAGVPKSTVLVSFIDNNEALNMISYDFVYDISDSIISYSPSLPDLIQFNRSSLQFEFEINPNQIAGPVSTYNISRAPKGKQRLSQGEQRLSQGEQRLSQLTPGSGSGLSQLPASDSSLCSLVEINSTDLFTKTSCLKYYNAKEDGIMQDFITYSAGLFDAFTIVVTDLKILCVEDRQVRESRTKNKTSDCSIYEEGIRIFIICIENEKSTIDILKIVEKCEFEIVRLENPSWLKYSVFKMVYSDSHAVFEVPIRYQQNKVYYLTTFNLFDNTFSDSFAILKRSSQEEFLTKDFSVKGDLLFLLENGLGLYNLSREYDVNEKITPLAWIEQANLKSILGVDEELVYVNLIAYNLLERVIDLEVGTLTNSYELHIKFRFGEDDSISIDSLSIHYTYLNPWNCMNSLLSKSRSFENMSIKICTYEPQQHYVFSKFIPITENKQNSFIMFYEKRGYGKTYPFRTDIIYTNAFSNDNFQIINGKLIIGSLFNLLCYYDLKDKYRFTFSVDRKELERRQQKDAQDPDFEQSRLEHCHFALNMSNANYELLYPLSIQLDFSSGQELLWQQFKFYIQRIIFLAIFANFCRLEIRRSRVISKRKSKGLPGTMKTIESFDNESDSGTNLNSKKQI